MVLLPDALFGPAHRNRVLLGVGVNPAQILIGTFSERFLADAVHLLYRPKEVNKISGRDNVERYPLITTRSKQ